MNKGFSLVELIVVIAIMAILVGIAVPVYTQYISKANVSVDTQTIEEVERAAETVAITAKAGMDGLTEDSIGSFTINAKTGALEQAKDSNGTITEDSASEVFLKAVQAIISPSALKSTETDVKITVNTETCVATCDFGNHDHGSNSGEEGEDEDEGEGA